MNEDKNFVNPSILEQKIDATSLSMQIQSFVSKNKQISPSDWILLNRMIKQLNKQKLNESHKVLRSMRNRFEMIQNKYQGG